MSNESTVLSFEDAKLRARGRRTTSKAASADRFVSRSGSANYSDDYYLDAYQSNYSGEDRRLSNSRFNQSGRNGSLSYVFDIDFDGQNDTHFDYQNEFSNARLGVSNEDIANAEEEIGSASKKGFFAKLNDSMASKKRARNKAKAEKAFQKSVGSSDVSSASNAGPRAALYKAEMGSKQRRAARMQEGKSGLGTGLSFSFPALSLPDIPKKIMTTVCALGCIVLLVGMLYTPAQQYYQQVRERDRLTAEYEAIVDRNNSLQALVDNLESDEGIEDKAHSEFGLIKEGEHAGAVTGFEVDSPSDFQANIAPGSIPAPETWYSGFLDILFGYSG